MPRDVGVIVVAAGRSARLPGAIPKQFRPLAGVPLLLRALRPFTAHPEVAHTVVVLPEAEAAAPPEWLAPLTGGTLSLAAGGPERTDSVARGLDRLPEGCLTVLVHDGARPLVDRAIIDSVIATAREGVGAVPAIPVPDTIKETSGAVGGRVVRTVPRDRLWRAQTPQGFPRSVLERAYAEARARGETASDDAALVEQLGVEVRVVPGSVRNLKVTTEEDWAVVQALVETSERR